ncbi:MAG: nucleotide sugar dehydrogenase, partial [Caldilineaceae bacterium]
MKISIFGLGYVGCVSAACFANDGHEVIGVDVDNKKLDAIRQGRSPVVEPGLDEMVCQSVRNGKLRVTQSTEEAICDSEVSLICVGTPSNSNGSLKTDYVENVVRDIGKALRTKDAYHVVVIRSTVLPGTVEEQVLPLLELYTGKRAGEDFGLAMNPEFLRESSAVADYYNPPYVVIGEFDKRTGEALKNVYSGVDAPVIFTSIRSAEMLKYANNAFHALKITFANEIGNLCKAHGVDGQEVMQIFCRDTQLNISPYYLRPGFAFGGSCLPKDTRALLYRAKERDVELPVLNAVLESNYKQIQRGIQMVEATGSKKVGVLGLSFKSGTDDVRESPVVPLVETLVGRGYEVSIYDDQVKLSNLIGANKLFLERELPHIAQLMRPSIDELLADNEVIVITNGSATYKDALGQITDKHIIVDLDGAARIRTDL